MENQMQPLARAAVLIFAIRLLAQAEIPTADDAAIRKVIANFADAENKHDGKAIANLFLPDSPDREPISKQIASEGGVWTEKGPKRIDVDGIRFVKPDVALVDTTAKWYQSIMHASSRQMLILVKDHGEWKISVYRGLTSWREPRTGK
jgi:ketosteroid isomerase-like protein